MMFASDNWAGATAAVMEAVNRANSGYAPAYGNDELTARVNRLFCDVFERDVEVHFITSGTAANTVSLMTVARPAGLVFCTEQAHIHSDEFNAAEFSTGMKLIPVATDNGLMQADALEAAMARLPEGRTGPATVLSLTNASEHGTVYSAEHVAELSAIAKRRGMAVHIDGARFANAVAAAGASPADLSWRAGVDLMSFGGTKNGCIAAEAVVVFEPGRFPDIANIRQRHGQGLSKARFIAAQFEGYFADGGWLKTAAHANAMAARLSDGIAKSNAARLPWRSDANELFPILPATTVEKLRTAGAKFYTWEKLPGGDEMVRLVTSFATTPEDVDSFLALL